MKSNRLHGIERDSIVHHTIGSAVPLEAHFLGIVSAELVTKELAV